MRGRDDGSRRGRLGRGGAGSAICVLGGILVAAAIAAIAGRADAEHDALPHPDLDRLIERFDAGASPHESSVRLDAWIETAPEGDEVVVVLEPQGDFKLVADPGITVTPTEQPGVEWLVPLPYRHVDPEISYFTAPAAVRLPFRADTAQPLEILVEYAYCVVDYQCFFGEELLTVTARYDSLPVDARPGSPPSPGDFPIAIVSRPTGSPSGVGLNGLRENCAQVRQPARQSSSRPAGGHELQPCTVKSSKTTRPSPSAGPQKKAAAEPAAAARSGVTGCFMSHHCRPSAQLQRSQGCEHVHWLLQ